MLQSSLQGSWLEASLWKGVTAPGRLRNGHPCSLGINVASIFSVGYRGAPGRGMKMKSCETLERMLKMSAGDREKTGKVVARSFYTVLRQNGFTQAEIMRVTGYILDGVIKDMKVNGKDREKPVEMRSSDNWPHTKVVA